VNPHSSIQQNYIVALNESIVWSANTNYSSTYKFFSRTNNGGASWFADSIEQSEYSDYHLIWLSPIDFNTAWFVLRNSINNTILLKTTNGGNNWIVQDPLISYPWGYVYFWDQYEGICYAQTNQRLVVSKTYNGGISWTILDSNSMPINMGPFTGHKTYGNTIFIPTTWGKILISNDRGNNWSVINTNWMSGAAPVLIVKNLSHLILYRTGLNPIFSETLDGGNSWTFVNVQGPLCKFVSYVPNSFNTFVSVGASNMPQYVLSYSFDGGHHWIPWDTLTQENFYATSWANNSCGWAGSITKGEAPQNTGIYKFTGVLQDILQLDPITGGLLLYPIPAREQITIIAIGFQGTNVELSICDIFGRKIYLQKLYQNDMQLTECIITSKFKPGLYICTVKNRTHTFSRNFTID
jgi:hypothetical protein